MFQEHSQRMHKCNLHTLVLMKIVPAVFCCVNLVKRSGLKSLFLSVFDEKSLNFKKFRNNFSQKLDQTNRQHSSTFSIKTTNIRLRKLNKFSVKIGKNSRKRYICLSYILTIGSYVRASLKCNFDFN